MTVVLSYIETKGLSGLNYVVAPLPGITVAQADAARYLGAPDLPTSSNGFERFARSVGLIVAEDLPGAGACISQTTERPPGAAPMACSFVGRLRAIDRAREAYVVFYDDRAMAYAVMTRYEYTRSQLSHSSRIERRSFIPVSAIPRYCSSGLCARWWRRP